MQTQTVEFAVTRNKGNITRIGMTSIPQPKTNFKGGSIKWYKDKPKQESKQFLPDSGRMVLITAEFDSLYVPFQWPIEN